MISMTYDLAKFNLVILPSAMVRSPKSRSPAYGWSHQTLSTRVADCWGCGLALISVCG